MARVTQVLRSATSSDTTAYCPDSGDLIWLNFNPQAGREQSGRRPALVLSPRAYNQISRLCVLCPVTNQGKGYPFEVHIPDGSGVTGYVLSDQIRSLSWAHREAAFIATVPDAVVLHTKAKIKALMQLP